MEKLAIKIKILDEAAILPTYGTPFSAGADLYALCAESILIQPGQTVLIHTGLAFEIPEGYGGFVFARSGLATKKGLAPANKVGVIDSDYRGPVTVVLFNHGRDAQTVENGQRIAQLVITPVLQVGFEAVEELDDTVRGQGGFGSTGR